MSNCPTGYLNISDDYPWWTSYKHSNLGHLDELAGIFPMASWLFKKTKAEKKADESLTETTEAQLNGDQILSCHVWKNG